MNEEPFTIRLTDLTLEQKEMLDKIWQLGTSEEMTKFRSTLPVFRQQQMDNLIQLILMEFEDQRATEDLSLAQNMLRELGYRV